MVKQQIITVKFLLVVFLLMSGCRQLSEKEADVTAGLNGGFEVSKNGLPVNWRMYTPNTVEDAEFEIVLDNNDAKEGNQSLKFKVDKCSCSGDWNAPGFTNEFFDIGKFEGEATYKLSFWVKNDGSTFIVLAGGVALKSGDINTLIQSNEQIDEWRKFEFEVDVPKEQWLRFQLNILAPGVFWIDDIRIEKA